MLLNTLRKQAEREIKNHYYHSKPTVFTKSEVVQISRWEEKEASTQREKRDRELEEEE